MSSPLHHYVSQLSLRRFGRGKMYQIYVFDKSNGKSFSGAANKLAAERELYDFEFMGVSVTLEPSLADLESEAALCIESILQRGRLAVELPEMMKERATIIRFLAVQFVRTAGAFAQQANLGDQLESMLRADGMPEDYFRPPSEVGTSENARKANFSSHICRANKDLGPALCSKEWVLFQTDRQQPFLLGDHPVVLDNLFGGKLGLGVPGVVIYFPLSPEFALGLHSLSIAEEFRQEHERLAGLSDEVLVRNPGLYACFEQTVCILEGFQKGLPVQLQPENVENLNSLQVINAERFVFSSDGNFALVEDMMRTNPELRKGPRVAVKRGL